MENNMPEVDRPKVNSKAQIDLEKAKENIDGFSAKLEEHHDKFMSTKHDMTDSSSGKVASEPQHRLSQNEISNMSKIYLKPYKIAPCRDKFNEKFRADWEFKKEIVCFIAQHNELKGEEIDIVTRPMGGIDGMHWKVPTNKPVYGPRYLAEQIKKKSYIRYVAQNPNQARNAQENIPIGHMGIDYTDMIGAEVVNRMDAFPVTNSKSVFLSEKTFK